MRNMLLTSDGKHTSVRVLPREQGLISLQTMLLYLVGTVERLPTGSPLLKGNRLPVDSILMGAGLMTGQKSAHPTP